MIKTGLTQACCQNLICVKEEIDEFEHARDRGDVDKVTDELGDILFSLVNVSRFLGIRAEDALQGTIEKFRKRFGYVEKELASRGSMTLDEMDAIWEKSKKDE